MNFYPGDVMKRAMILTGILIFWGVNTSTAQYSAGNQPLWLQYESESFFFQPNFYKSGQTSSFQQLAAGWNDESLDLMAINPALANPASVKRNKFYLDVRSRHHYRKDYLYYDYIMPASSFLPGPPQFGGSSRVMDPFISVAWLSQPLLNDRLTVGLSYQNLYFDGSYYRADTDVLHSSAMASTVQPQELSKDRMRQMGHFGRVSFSYQLTARWNVGFQIGKAWFNRDGEAGPYPIYNVPYPTLAVYSPLPYSRGQYQRHQQYDHWDVNIGTAYRNAEKGLLLSLKGGYLAGSGLQQGGLDFSNVYQEGRIDETDTWNYQALSTVKNEDWNEDGTTWYAGFFGRKSFGDWAALRLRFDTYLGDSDLSSTGMLDNFSRYDQQGSTNYYKSNSYSYDYRKGAGSRNNDRYRAAAFGTFKLDYALEMNLGLQLEINNTDYAGLSRVNYMNRSASSSGTLDGGRDSQSLIRSEEQKSLNWSRYVDYKTLHLPIVISRKFSGGLKLSAGLLHSRYDVDSNWSETIHYDYRETENLSDGVQRRENFDERQVANPLHFNGRSTALLTAISWQPLEEVELNVSALPLLSQPDQFDNDGKMRWQIGLIFQP